MGANQGMSAVQVEGNQTAGAFARLAIVQKDPNNKIPTNAVARPGAKITENIDLLKGESLELQKVELEI